MFSLKNVKNIVLNFSRIIDEVSIVCVHITNEDDDLAIDSVVLYL